MEFPYQRDLILVVCQTPFKARLAKGPRVHQENRMPGMPESCMADHRFLQFVFSSFWKTNSLISIKHINIGGLDETAACCSGCSGSNTWLGPLKSTAPFLKTQF